MGSITTENDDCCALCQVCEIQLIIMIWRTNWNVKYYTNVSKVNWSTTNIWAMCAYTFSLIFMNVMNFFHRQAPLDTTSTESSALQATEFSRMVSTLGPHSFDIKSSGILNNATSKPNEEKKIPKLHKDMSSIALTYCNTSAVTPVSRKEDTCGEEEGCQCSRNSISLTLSEVEACFCYSCRLLAREMVCILYFISYYIVLRTKNPDNQLMTNYSSDMLSAVKKLSCKMY